MTFDGQSFAAGVPTRAAYKFNSYRLTYRYTLLCNRCWTLRIGATAKIRDARVQLGVDVAIAHEVFHRPREHLVEEVRQGHAARALARPPPLWARMPYFC